MRNVYRILDGNHKGLRPLWLTILWHVDPLLGNDLEISNCKSRCSVTAPQRSMYPRQQENTTILGSGVFCAGKLQTRKGLQLLTF
jgi:hypothetical protein